ncbi:MAG: hypothetical protein K0Q69_3662, partial [Devosia sp.]|nr:hypothetical protein [Devosia sp.]
WDDTKVWARSGGKSTGRCGTRASADVGRAFAGGLPYFDRWV